MPFCERVVRALTEHSTIPFSVKWSSFAVTALSWLQKGHVNMVATFGATFLGGGLLDLRFPCEKRKRGL